MTQGGGAEEQPDWDGDEEGSGASGGGVKAGEGTQRAVAAEVQREEDVWTVRTRHLPRLVGEGRVYRHRDDYWQRVTANLIAAAYPSEKMAWAEAIPFLDTFGYVSELWSDRASREQDPNKSYRWRWVAAERGISRSFPAMGRG